MNDRINAIHDFWFAGTGEDPDKIGARIKTWFTRDDAFDAIIRERFLKDFQDAEQGRLKAWEEDPKGLLALILLFDQFSRNLYRATPRAFSQDRLALSLSLGGIEKGQDQELGFLERAFFYLPFQHSEKLEIQEQSPKLFKKLASQAPRTLKKMFEGFVQHAREHRYIIRRFGRFPHRNVLLGRTSTAEEEAFLKTRTSWYGQDLQDPGNIRNDEQGDRQEGKPIDFDEQAKTWDSPDKVLVSRTIAEAIVQAVPLDSFMKAMEYGCGTGTISVRGRP